MSHFIQNSGENSLSRIINGLLPSKTKTMDFLVGYFYFSGIQEIYQNLEDKPMRILVGLDMDHELLNKTSEIDFFAQNHRPTSNKDVRDKFYSSIVNLFNQTNYFENDAQAEAFKIYYEKIKNGTLQIKKTLDPNHAKMYIFAYKDDLTEDGETPGTVITGSSNFTYSGLRSNNEINVRFHTNDEFQDAQKIFNDLWETATVVVDKDHIQDFEEGVIKHIWFEKTPSPYLLYLRVLYEYFNLDESKHILTPNEITYGDFLDLKYQEDAIRIALDTISRHNGAIVADVVGLGKSIIGSAIARNLNLRTLVIAPPHLVPQWEDYSYQFGFNARIFSRGNLQKVLEFYLDKHHEGETMLIIIDEAHSYRNEYIQDYAILHEICQNNKVLLLTATPFNNRPDDIYAMIKLFQIPTKSTLQTVDNLGARFSSLISRYKKMRKDQREGKYTDETLKAAIEYIGKDIRRIISPLVIRRSRLDLEKIPAYRKDLKLQHISFPEVLPPTLKTYRLRNLTDLYVGTLETISPKETSTNDAIDDDAVTDNVENRIESDKPVYQAARYKAGLYLTQEGTLKIQKEIEDAGLDFNLFIGRQRSLASFMRTLLVRRFESSQYAFKKSLDQMLRNSMNVKNWIAKRNAVPVYKKGALPNILDMYNSNDDKQVDIDEKIADEIENLKVKGLFEIKSEYLQQEFFNDLDSDIAILQDLKKKWDKIGDYDDPKYDGFVDLLKDQLQHDPDRKIVVFSQFADTVDYLGKRLKEDALPVFIYTSNKATLANKEIISKNFDAGLKKAKQENDYQILVATDAISEGYNLHRAGCIYNYDIPYNPTRVIQRVGRINRINKKVFEKLYIYNYFPTEIGEDETNIKQITTMKMAMIHAIMGEDTKYLTADEAELNSYFAEQYNNLVAADEEESWDTPFRVLLDELKDTEEMEQAINLPLRSKVRRLSTVYPSGVLAFARKNGDLVFKMSKPDSECETLSPKDAFEIVKAEKDEKGYALSEAFAELFDDVKHSLFIKEVESEKDKTKRDARDKVSLIMRNSTVDQEYLEELMKAIELDAISGYSLRAINRLKRNEFSKITETVSREYVQAVLHNYDNISHGVETLIVAEEITNVNQPTETE